MTLLESIIVIPILAAAAIGFGLAPRSTALGAALLNAVLVVAVFGSYDLQLEGGYQLAGSHPLYSVADRAIPGAQTVLLGFSTGADGITLVLLLMTALVSLAALWIKPEDDRIGGRYRLYYILLLLAISGAMGVYCSTDLFFFFVFLLLSLASLLLLTASFGRGKQRKRLARKLAVYLGTGSLITLGGLFTLFLALGASTLQLADMQGLAEGENTFRTDTQQKGIFLTLLLGFGILAGLFPFHFWVTGVCSAAPSSAAMIHVGVVRVAGLYGMIRIAVPMLPEGASHWQTLMLLMTSGNLLYAAYVAAGQKRIDLMSCHVSSVSVGYAMLGIVSVHVLGVLGATMMMFAHGLGIVLMITLCSHLQRSLGMTDRERVGEARDRLPPSLERIIGISILAVMAFPLFTGFSAWVLILVAGFTTAYSQEQGLDLSGLPLVSFCALWSAVIVATSHLRAYRLIFAGQDGVSTETCTGQKFSLMDRIPLFVIIFLLLWTGLMPGLLIQYLVPTIEHRYLVFELISSGP